MSSTVQTIFAIISPFLPFILIGCLVLAVFFFWSDIVDWFCSTSFGQPLCAIGDALGGPGGEAAQDAANAAKNVANTAAATAEAALTDPESLVNQIFGESSGPNPILPPLASCPSPKYEDNMSPEAKKARKIRIGAQVAAITIGTGGVSLAAAPLVAWMANVVEEQCTVACPTGWKSDGLGHCYQECPKGWKGDDSLLICGHDRTYSSCIGQGIDWICPPGTEKHFVASLSRNQCFAVPSGYEYINTTTAAKKCPSGYNSSDTKCTLPYDDFQRGKTISIGWSLQSDCQSDNPGCGCEKPSGYSYWYPKCVDMAKKLGKQSPTSYHAEGAGFRGMCARSSVSTNRETKSIKGQEQQCPNGSQAGANGTSCCPACPAGYTRLPSDPEYCDAICPSGWKDLGGIGGCAKPSQKQISDPLSKVGLCKDPNFPVFDKGVCRKSTNIIGKTRKGAPATTSGS